MDGGRREWKKAMWWNWSGLPKDKNGSNWTADGRWLASAKLSWALASRAGKGRAREPSGVQWQARASRPLPFLFRRLPRDSASLSTCVPNSPNMAVFGSSFLEMKSPAKLQRLPGNAGITKCHRVCMLQSVLLERGIRLTMHRLMCRACLAKELLIGQGCCDLIQAPPSQV